MDFDNSSIDECDSFNNCTLLTNETGMPRMRYVNVSMEAPVEYAQILYGYIMPFLLVITIVANTLIVIVLSKRHMKSPTNIVLMAMALSDMFTLLFPAPWLLYMYTFDNHAKPLYPVAVCYTYKIMQEHLPNLFHTASIWLTLALAVQRYIYVCHAPVARIWCTTSRVNKGIILIYFFATLHQSTRFVDKEYISWEIEWQGQPTEVCGWMHAYWVKDVITINVYYNFYYWFRVLFVHTIPCISLVVLNVLLFRAMREAQKTRERLVNENRRNECKKMRDSNCTTLMLIVVVTFFLVVEIPLAVVTILHIISSSLVEFLNYRVAAVLILSTNFFIILSYPLNFAIYCGMSKQFRETFKDLFIRDALYPRGTGPSTSTRYSCANGPKTNTNETIL